MKAKFSVWQVLFVVVGTILCICGCASGPDYTTRLRATQQKYAAYSTAQLELRRNQLAEALQRRPFYNAGIPLLVGQINSDKWGREKQEIEMELVRRMESAPRYFKSYVVGAFLDFNEVFKGTILNDAAAGEATIAVDTKISKVRCEGKSWVTYIPPTRGIVGQRGKALCSCTDGRILESDWIALSLNSGFGTGHDQDGHEFYFASATTEMEADEQIKSLVAAAGGRPNLEPPYRPKETRKHKGYSVGTGFFVTDDGLPVTNFHVVEGAKEFAIVTTDGKNLPARFVRGDEANDVALLKVESAASPIPMAENNNLSKGDDVFTLGYPLIDLQGQEQKATFGHVNALSGFGDDVRYTQIDVPVQPGNSGGPLINTKGQVVGIVTATLPILTTLRASGALPQNVNYAVKSDYVVALLRSAIPDKWKPAVTAGSQRDWKQLVKDSEQSVVQVIAK